MDDELMDLLREWYEAKARVKRLGRKHLYLNMKNGYQPGLRASAERVERARDDLQEVEYRLLRKFEFVEDVENPLPQHMFEPVKL